MEDTDENNKTFKHTKEIPEEIIKQIRQVRDSGKANMLDIFTVCVAADELGLLDLQKYLYFRSNREAYINFFLNEKLKNTKEANQLQN